MQDSRFPRLVSCRQARELGAAGRLRLAGVCDVSCDLRGSIELLCEFTSIEEPFYVFDVATGAVSRDLSVPGVLYHAVDHREEGGGGGGGALLFLAHMFVIRLLLQSRQSARETRRRTLARASCHCSHRCCANRSQAAAAAAASKAFLLKSRALSSVPTAR